MVVRALTRTGGSNPPRSARARYAYYAYLAQAFFGILAKMSYNMSNDMSNQPPDPLNNLPDPVIFYDREGRVTGQMSKAEILEKNLVLVYSKHGPRETKTAEESRREDEEYLANGGYPKRIADLRRKIGIL